jgi:transcription antitermination factor NusG
MAYWACAQIDGRHEALALRCLSIAGYNTYQPRVRSARRVSEPLFPSYVFITIQLQWHSARWAPGMRRIILAGDQPAHVPDAVIDGLRARERNGLVVLPRPPSSAPQFRPGDEVRIRSGPLTGLSGLVSGMRQRVEVLLKMLGGLQRVELSAADVEPARE